MLEMIGKRNPKQLFSYRNIISFCYVQATQPYFQLFIPPPNILLQNRPVFANNGFDKFFCKTKLQINFRWLWGKKFTFIFFFNYSQNYFCLSVHFFIKSWLSCPKKSPSHLETHWVKYRHFLKFNFFPWWIINVSK